MRNGNFIDKKRGYIFEKFRTKEGLFDFFVGTVVWSFIILKFYRNIFEFFLDFYKIGFEPLKLYLSYLSVGVTFTLIGFMVSVLLVNIFHMLIGGKK
jgi:hypothetical protein